MARFSTITYVKHAIVALALAAAMLLLTSFGSGSAPSQGKVAPASTLKITTSTTFYPAFGPTITDYVTTIQSGSPVQVSVNAPAGTQVSVDGQPFRTLTFTTPVSISAGQSFTIVVNSQGSSSTYYVRGLPSDFPTWTTLRSATPQAQYYAFAPDIAIASNGAPRHYLIIADGNGVPVWWYRSSDNPRNALLLPNGNIAFTVSTCAEEHKLNGALVRSFTAAASIGGILDLHELQQLPNGDYILIAEVARGPVDLAAYRGYPTAEVSDSVIEEIAPNGSLVWHWSAMDHIPVSETESIWWPQSIWLKHVADPYHMNSVEPNGSSFVVSFRHLDAVYRIDKASGKIVWKLGGTHRAESLTFSGDKVGNFGGQHDARVLPDGTLTVYDNGTERGRGPRAVRYSINTTAATATLVEQVVDPSVTQSECCGSARKLAGGNWGITWGLSPVVTELTPAGAIVFRMTNNEPYFSYRAEPVPFGVLSPFALRTAMDSQYPR